MSAERPNRVERLTALVIEGRVLLEQAHAATADWSALATREARLRERLTELLVAPLAPQEVAAVRIALQELLTLNQQAVQAIEARKADTVAALEHAALVRRAATAYGNAAASA